MNVCGNLSAGNGIYRCRWASLSCSDNLTVSTVSKDGWKVVCLADDASNWDKVGADRNSNNEKKTSESHDEETTLFQFLSSQTQPRHFGNRHSAASFQVSTRLRSDFTLAWECVIYTSSVQSLIMERKNGMNE